MRKIIFTLFISTLSSAGFSQSLTDGNYVGLEKICWSLSKKGKCINYDTKNPDRTWFYENTFRFKGDSVFLTQRSTHIYGKDTLTDNSGSGPLHSSGTFTVKGNEILISVSYEKTSKHYVGKLTKEGIMIQKYTYRKR